MYDPRSEPKEFIGENQAEAVAKACSFFGSDESGLRIREVEPGQVFGLGGRAAVVAVPAGARPAPARPPRDRGRESKPRPAPRAREEAAPMESVGQRQGELGPVGEFVLGLIERLELGNFEIRESREGDNLIVQAHGPAALHLTEEDTRVVAALQLLANQVAMRLDDGPRRVIVDIESAAEKRESYLARVAERAAERARESGRGVALEPMNPRDRRAVHVALRDAEGIATMSVGEGRYRQVVVVPEGAPEYEEALRASEESASETA